MFFVSLSSYYLTCRLALGVKSTTKGGHMRLLRLLIFCFFVLAFGLLPCFAQNSTSQDSQKPSTSQAPPAQQPSQPPSGIVRDPFAQQPAGPTAPQLTPNSRPFRIQTAPRRRIFKPQPRQLPDRDLDPGIYMRRSAGLNGNICGSIVSYNFSRDDNPHLESITTCTPANPDPNMRANDDHKPPEPPRIVQTNLQK